MGKNTTFVYVILGLLVLGFLFGVVFPAMRGEDSLYTNFSSSKQVVDTGTVNMGDDLTPRIMYRSGKVNKYVDGNGNRQNDPDKKSGADIDKLSYCKKWYPKTVSTYNYKREKVASWISIKGGTGVRSSERISVGCMQP